MKQLVILITVLAISWSGYGQVDRSSDFYKTILQLDKDFFTAYNSCETKLETYGSFYDDNIEFYHDQGGLVTSKQEIIESTKNNICGKVKRELVESTVEVHPIKDYGAVMTGYHKFHNLVEKSISEPVKFVVIWKLKNDDWKISRVISLH